MDGCTLVVLKVMHIVVKRTQSYVNVMVSSNFALQPIQELLEAYFKIKFNGEQEKESIICVGMG